MEDKKNIDEKLCDALDMSNEPTEIVKEESKEIKAISTPPDFDLKRDYNLVRKNLKEIIDTGNTAIDGILTVASETESPRAYEVAAQMIKNVADVNKDLIEMHNKMKQIKKDSADQRAQNITNNSLFVGSTKELQKMIQDQNKQIVANQVEEEHDIIDVESEVVDGGED